MAGSPAGSPGRIPGAATVAAVADREPGGNIRLPRSASTIGRSTPPLANAPTSRLTDANTRPSMPVLVVEVGRVEVLRREQHAASRQPRAESASRPRRRRCPARKGRPPTPQAPPHRSRPRREDNGVDLCPRRTLSASAAACPHRKRTAASRRGQGYGWSRRLHSVCAATSNPGKQVSPAAEPGTRERNRGHGDHRPTPTASPACSPPCRRYRDATSATPVSCRDPIVAWPGRAGPRARSER